jgi:hypothetical protein
MVGGMSPDDFRELLQAKGASVECPVCGAEDWRGLDDIIDLPVRMVAATSNETHVRIPGFAALAPSCGRCGHVRLIDLQLLEAPVRQGLDPDQGRKPPEDVKLPDTAQAAAKGRSRQSVTNIWGDPISKRTGRKH